MFDLAKVLRIFWYTVVITYPQNIVLIAEKEPEQKTSAEPLTEESDTATRNAWIFWSLKSNIVRL